MIAKSTRGCIRSTTVPGLQGNFAGELVDVVEPLDSPEDPLAALSQLRLHHLHDRIHRTSASLRYWILSCISFSCKSWICTVLQKYFFCPVKIYLCIGKNTPQEFETDLTTTILKFAWSRLFHQNISWLLHRQ